jgi:hypothetical protein
MSKRLSILVGIGCVLVGCLGLFATQLAPLVGLDLWRWGPWRLWPLFVIGPGLGLVVVALVARRRGWATLFIPGLPILVTGSILMMGSLFNYWSIWTWLWPAEVLALALGFLLAALRMRSVWLAVPGIIVGLNGVVFQFCAITGLWESWAVLWAVEPLAVGLALLVAGAVKRSGGLVTAGLILCGLAGLSVMGMTMILSGFWWLNTIGAGFLIIIGLLILIWGLIRPAAPTPVPEPSSGT